MTKSPEILTFDIKHLTAELRRVEERLKSEPAPDPIALNDFRHAVDNVRLAAWSVGELLNAEKIKKSPNTVMAFLSAERLRRFNHLVKSLCSDIERGLINLETAGMQSLRESVEELKRKLPLAAHQRQHSYNVKDAS